MTTLDKISKNKVFRYTGAAILTTLVLGMIAYKELRAPDVQRAQEQYFAFEQMRASPSIWKSPWAKNHIDYFNEIIEQQYNKEQQANLEEKIENQ